MTGRVFSVEVCGNCLDRVLFCQMIHIRTDKIPVIQPIYDKFFTISQGLLGLQNQRWSHVLQYGSPEMC